MRFLVTVFCGILIMLGCGLLVGVLIIGALCWALRRWDS